LALFGWRRFVGLDTIAFELLSAIQSIFGDLQSLLFDDLPDRRVLSPKIRTFHMLG
jgi:hypothetical protein